MPYPGCGQGISMYLLNVIFFILENSTLEFKEILGVVIADIFYHLSYKFDFLMWK